MLKNIIISLLLIVATGLAIFAWYQYENMNGFMENKEQLLNNKERVLNQLENKLKKKEKCCDQIGDIKEILV